MRKILIILSTIIFSVSCISNFDFTPFDISNLDPYIEKTAPIKQDSITIIMADSIEICRTTVPLNYLFPKDATETIKYIPNDAKNYMNGGYDTYHFTACFEDTKMGDNDYNDFVCFITTIKTQDWSDWQNPTLTMTVYVQPLALGATKQLQFGIDFPNGNLWLATNDVRRDFFDSTIGFINTSPVTWSTPISSLFLTKDINHIMRHSITLPIGISSSQRINPFIISGNDTIYLALEKHNDESFDYSYMVGHSGYPYGIAIDGSFHYPYEKINIATCYPKFTNWLEGKNNNISKNNYVSSNVYSRIEDLILYNPNQLNWGN